MMDHHLLRGAVRPFQSAPRPVSTRGVVSDSVSGELTGGASYV